MKLRTAILALVLAIVLAVTWVAQQQIVIRRAERDVLLMDTFVRVVIHGRQSQARLEAVVDSTIEEMRRLESVLSAHLEGSDVTRINLAATAPTTVSAETMAVLLQAGVVYEKSAGAFDVTVGSLMRAWGFGTDTRQVPTPEELQRAMQGVGFDKVRFDEQTRQVQLLHVDTRLDFGGVAKGYIVDQAIAYLVGRGIEYAMVDAGGDVRIIGGIPGRFIWERPRLVRIGVQHPTERDALLAVVSTERGAVVTSGDYERYFVQDGVRYTHIVDPRTGLTVQGITSATVVADEAALADAVATAAMVLGAEAGIELIEAFAGVEGLLVTDTGEVIMSKGMSAFTEMVAR